MDEDGVLTEARGVVHCHCYQTYTSIKLLKEVEAGQQHRGRTDNKTDAMSTPSVQGRINRSQVPLTNFKKCIFCQQEKKTKVTIERMNPISVLDDGGSRITETCGKDNG